MKNAIFCANGSIYGVNGISPLLVKNQNRIAQSSRQVYTMDILAGLNRNGAINYIYERNYYYEKNNKLYY